MMVLEPDESLATPAEQRHRRIDLDDDVADQPRSGAAHGDDVEQPDARDRPVRRVVLVPEQ
ncbi:MAG: hypothetical protein R2697_01935 [Ilumatobacteraceae bacterium]